MVLPFNANKIEQLVVDPLRATEGYIWFNKTEQVYKTYLSGVINIFLTDLLFIESVVPYVDRAVATHQYSISFLNVKRIILKHNRGKTNCTYMVFDEEEQCTLNCSIVPIDENEIQIDFVDFVTGRIFMYFE